MELSQFMQRYGSKKLADTIGVCESTIQNWAHHKIPCIGHTNHKQKKSKRIAHAVLKLCQMTGCAPEELFPGFVRDKTPFTFKQKPSLKFISPFIIDRKFSIYKDEPEIRGLDLVDILKYLAPRELTVIKLRFGLSDVASYTLAEVGRALGITQERVRQIEARALRKLAKAFTNRRIQCERKTYVT